MAGATTRYVAVVGASQATDEDLRAAEAMIAIGGFYGTLPEIAFALPALAAAAAHP